MCARPVPSLELISPLEVSITRSKRFFSTVKIRLILTIQSFTDTLFLSVDGNFRLQLKKKLRDVMDIHLHDGHAYFRNEEEYKKYLATAKDDRVVRFSLFLFPPPLTLTLTAENMP